MVNWWNRLRKSWAARSDARALSMPREGWLDELWASRHERRVRSDEQYASSIPDRVRAAARKQRHRVKFDIEEQQRAEPAHLEAMVKLAVQEFEKYEYRLENRRSTFKSAAPFPGYSNSIPVVRLTFVLRQSDSLRDA